MRTFHMNVAAVSLMAEQEPLRRNPRVFSHHQLPMVNQDMHRAPVPVAKRNIGQKV